MARQRKVEAFSKYRLGGEPLPADLAILLSHASDFAERTGIELNGEKGWAPWSDTSYLAEVDRANPDIMANVRAIAEVCGLIAFVAAHEDGEYFGYWRGPTHRPVSECPLVLLDNEGQFEMYGFTLAEAILNRTDDDELRDWFRSIGVAVPARAAADFAVPLGEVTPKEMQDTLYSRYRREAGLP